MKLNKKGVAEIVGCSIMMFSFITMCATHYYVKTGKNIFKAKKKTVDTVENPAAPLVPYGPNNYK